jgi:hypothetical protein
MCDADASMVLSGLADEDTVETTGFEVSDGDVDDNSMLCSCPAWDMINGDQVIRSQVWGDGGIVATVAFFS